MVALLACVAGALSWRGVAGMSDIRADMAVVEGATERMNHAGRSIANLLSYARAVEFLPLELTAEQRRKFEAAASLGAQFA